MPDRARIADLLAKAREASMQAYALRQEAVALSEGGNPELAILGLKRWTICGAGGARGATMVEITDGRIIVKGHGTTTEDALRDAADLALCEIAGALRP